MLWQHCKSCETDTFKVIYLEQRCGMNRTTTKYDTVLNENTRLYTYNIKYHTMNNVSLEYSFRTSAFSCTLVNKTLRVCDVSLT